MKELLKRSFTGLIFISIIIGAILCNKLSSGTYTYTVAGLFLLTSILGLIEFFKLIEKAGFNPKKSIVAIIGILIYLIIFLYSLNETKFNFLFIVFPLLILIVVLEIFRKKETPISNIAFSIMGILYVIVPFALLNLFAYGNNSNNIISISSPNNPAYLLLGFFIIQWACDSGAYLAGTTFGKTKLLPRISPNKTWEGFFGGLILAMFIGYSIAYLIGSNPIHWLLISIIIVVFGTLGDLTESQIKRSAGVKDSGNLLPGHGGILDRFDGVLFSAPFVLAYLHFVDLFKLFS